MHADNGTHTYRTTKQNRARGEKEGAGGVEREKTTGKVRVRGSEAGHGY